MLISIQVPRRVAMLGCSALTLTVCCAWVAAILTVVLEDVEVAQLLLVQTCGAAGCSRPQNVLSCGPEKLGETLSLSLGVLLWSLGSLPVQG